MAQAAKAALRSIIWTSLRIGYFKGEELLACEQAGVAVTLPKPQTREPKCRPLWENLICLFGHDDVYRCRPARSWAHTYRGLKMARKMADYLTKACRTMPVQGPCTSPTSAAIKPWEHEHVVEARADAARSEPAAMRVRRERRASVATLKMRMGATTLSNEAVAQCRDRNGAERIAYNLTRV